MPTLLVTNRTDLTSRASALAPDMNALSATYNILNGSGLVDSHAGSGLAATANYINLIDTPHAGNTPTMRIYQGQLMPSPSNPLQAGFSAPLSIGLGSLVGNKNQAVALITESTGYQDGVNYAIGGLFTGNQTLGNGSGGGGMGVYAEGITDRSYGGAVGANIVVTDNSSTNKAWSSTPGTTLDYGVDILLTVTSGSAIYTGAALGIRAGGGRWDVGIGFEAADIVRTADFITYDFSTTVFKVNGTHTTGLDFSGATISGNEYTGAHASITAAGVITGVGLALGTTPAAAGTLRLPNATYITARNAANGADVNMIRIDSSDLVAFGANLAAHTLGGTVTGNSQTISGVGAFSAASGAFGTTPAAAGTLRLPNATYITARNAANSGDINMVQVNASNLITFGANLAALTLGGAITGNSQNITGLGTVGGTIGDMSTGYRIGGAAASGHYLRGDGTNYIDSVIQLADLATAFGAWATSTPTVTSGTGTLTSVASVYHTKTVGKTFLFELEITITTNGTGASYISMPSGVLPAFGSACGGGKNRVVGPGLSWQVGPGGAFTIVNFDNTYPGSSGAVLSLTGSFEIQ